MRSRFAALLVALCGATAPAGGQTLPRHAVIGAGVAPAAAGARVTLVVAQSAAASAGLQSGDLITNLGGTPVDSVASYLRAAHALNAGSATTMTIVRDGQARVLALVPSSAPDEREPGLETIYGTITVEGTLRRTLVTQPRNARGKHPALLLIGGIGCFSIDVATRPQDAYLRLTHDLARAGFVTMRLEKSGVGDSQGPPCRTVDFAAESASYALALEALRRNPAVDSKRIYLFGHSIGETIAPRLALAAPVAGVIVAEGTSINWIEYELRNLRRQLAIGPDRDPPTTIDAKMLRKNICMQRLLVFKESERALLAELPDCAEFTGIYPVDAPYVQELADLNMAEPWTQLAVPVLAIDGTADYVCDPADQERIVEIVNSTHPGSATLAVMPGMTHELARSTTPDAAAREYADHTQLPYDTDLSGTVRSWLCARETCSSANS